MAQGQIDDANRPARRPTRLGDAEPRTLLPHDSRQDRVAVRAGVPGHGPARRADASRRSTALRAYGENLGLAFQVVDDILDFTSTEAGARQAGRQRPAPGHDHAAGDPDARRQLADGRLRAAFESDDVDLQVRLVQESGAIAAAYAEADALVARARAALRAAAARRRARRAGRAGGLRHPARALSASGRGTCAAAGRASSRRTGCRRRRARRATSAAPPPLRRQSRPRTSELISASGQQQNAEHQHPRLHRR